MPVRQRHRVRHQPGIAVAEQRAHLPQRHRLGVGGIRTSARLRPATDGLPRAGGTVFGGRAHAEVRDVVGVHAEQEPRTRRGLVRRHEHQLKLAVPGRDQGLGVTQHEHPGTRVRPGARQPVGVAAPLRRPVNRGAGKRKPAERPVVKLVHVGSAHALTSAPGSAETDGMLSQSRSACENSAALAAM